jgi:L-threonylcarbamoyladenylate synthase
MQNFWPGLLSLNLSDRKLALNWDLGDGNTLDQISVRVPDSQFILEVLKKSGPVAIASAALVGERGNQTISADISYLESDVAAIFTAGVLPKGSASTVIDLTGIRKRIVREGAVSSQRNYRPCTRHFSPVRLRLARMSSETFYGPDFALLSQQDPDIAAVLLV